MTTIDMTMAVLVGGLFAAGFHLMLQRSLMRIVLGFIVLGHGTNLLLLTAGGGPGDPPILGDGVSPESLADPLPQAMALTSIVITFGLTAFLMALAYRAWRLSGHDEVRDDPEDRFVGTARERAGIVDFVTEPDAGLVGRGTGPDEESGSVTPGDDDAPRERP